MHQTAARRVLIRFKPAMVIHDNRTDRRALSRRRVLQISALSTVDCKVVAYNGDNGYGVLGYDSGELVLEITNTSKEGSRRANCPIRTPGGSEQKYRCGALWAAAIGMSTMYTR
jgi:hypothetical protein